jgi:DNA-binding MarR family transcriptional regulator
MLSDEQIHELFTAMKHSAKVMQTVFHMELKKLGITVPQARVMKVLYKKGPLSLVRLSEEMNTSTSSLSGIVDRMERMGLVVRRRGKKDRRVVYIELSEKAKDMKDLFPNEVKFFRKYTSSLSADEMIQLTKHIKRFTQSLEEGLKKWHKE